jgi:tRNA pseudouridine55 synthase
MSGGIVLLDKPLGLSSNAALQRVRTLFGRIKAGHVGSLDPLASGMLPICLGEATKIAGEILAHRKCYRFTVALGVATATGDSEGAVTARAAVPALEHDAVAAVVASFRGAQRQVPPMFSALKRDGQPLYRLARAGLTVERPARDIELYRLELVTLEQTALTLEALCSKGTYVRVLAEDLARALGSVGHVSALRRLYVEPFAGHTMHSLAELAAARAAGRSDPVLPIDLPLAHLPAVHLAEAPAQRLLHGQSIVASAAGTDLAAGRVRLYDAAGAFLGLGERDRHGTVQPRRLVNPQA